MPRWVPIHSFPISPWHTVLIIDTVLIIIIIIIQVSYIIIHPWGFFESIYKIYNTLNIFITSSWLPEPHRIDELYSSSYISHFCFNLSIMFFTLLSSAVLLFGIFQVGLFLLYSFNARLNIVSFPDSFCHHLSIGHYLILFYCISFRYEWH